VKVVPEARRCACVRVCVAARYTFAAQNGVTRLRSDIIAMTFIETLFLNLFRQQTQVHAAQAAVEDGRNVVIDPWLMWRSARSSVSPRASSHHSCNLYSQKTCAAS
jgi:hypothetical protein